jgi:hypothetical protein
VRAKPRDTRVEQDSALSAQRSALSAQRSAVFNLKSKRYMCVLREAQSSITGYCAPNGPTGNAATLRREGIVKPSIAFGGGGRTYRRTYINADAL